MAKASKSYKRLKSLADDDWAAMATESKEKKQVFLEVFEDEVAKWRERRSL
jgi:hypothetical protein